MLRDLVRLLTAAFFALMALEILILTLMSHLWLGVVVFALALTWRLVSPRRL